MLELSFHHILAHERDAGAGSCTTGTQLAESHSFSVELVVSYHSSPEEFPAKPAGLELGGVGPTSVGPTFLTLPAESLKKILPETSL